MEATAAAWSGLPVGFPDRLRAVQCHPAAAEAYDFESEGWDEHRARVVDLLGLSPGEVVLDVGCGLGCRERLGEQVGPGGLVVGIDQHPDTLQPARQQMARPGWTRGELISRPPGGTTIPVVADAALFCCTHDVLRNRPALQDILGRVRPGGRVAALGFMWAPWWAPALNLLIWNATEGYVTTYDGFSAPWSHLAILVPALTVERHELRGHFFATGTLPPAPDPGARVAPAPVRRRR